jgi:hypothetical protein
MNRIVPILTAFSLLVASSAGASLVSQHSAANDTVAEFNKRMPPKEAAIASAAREAENTGWDLYRTETLADMAGYALAATTTAAQRAGITGSIVIPGQYEWTVRFYARNERGAYVPTGDVVFDSNDRPSVRTDGLNSFSAQEAALIRATELVKSKDAPCEGSYKTVALLRNDRTIHVYSLREALDATHLPEGQHIRYIVSADGSKIQAQREYARRCNLVSTDISDDTKEEELKLTNSSDPQPTEVIVYLSLRYGVNIFEATMQSNLYWRINKGIVTTD